MQRSLLRRQGSSMIFRGTSGTLPFNFYPLQHSTGLRKATTLERLISMRSLPFSSSPFAINRHPADTTMITMTIDEYTSSPMWWFILDELAWKLTSWKVNKIELSSSFVQEKDLLILFFFAPSLQRRYLYAK